MLDSTCVDSSVTEGALLIQTSAVQTSTFNKGISVLAKKKKRRKKKRAGRVHGCCIDLVLICMTFQLVLSRLYTLLVDIKSIPSISLPLYFPKQQELH